MPRKVVYKAQIEYLQILDQTGKLDEKLAADTLRDDELVNLYEMMIKNRELDQTAFNLQRAGRMGTYPPSKGAEAVMLGAVKAMQQGVDYLVPTYREPIAMIQHGMPEHLVYLFWMGDEQGNQLPADVTLHPMCLEVGAQTLHAAGIAWAFKLRKEKRAVVCFLGDGATSTGDFHEAMNFASIYHLPIVFSCINNGWAISLPRSRQTGSQTLAQKALAYGIQGLQVDGNDIFAVYKAHREAIERARSGEGPSFIESVTYRLGDHTTADDAGRYRTAEELKKWQDKDPMTRLRIYLESRGLWDQQKQQDTEQAVKQAVRNLARQASDTPAGAVPDIFNYVYAQIPPSLAVQRDTMHTNSLGQDPSQVGLQKRAGQSRHAGSNAQTHLAGVK